MPVTELSNQQLKAIADRWLQADMSSGQIGLISEDIISCSNRSISLCENLDKYKARNTEGWWILDKAMDSRISSIRKDFECIQYATFVHEYKSDDATKNRVINAIKDNESKKSFLIQLSGIAQASSNNDEVIAKLDVGSKAEAFELYLTKQNVYINRAIPGTTTPVDLSASLQNKPFKCATGLSARSFHNKHECHYQG